MGAVASAPAVGLSPAPVAWPARLRSLDIAKGIGMLCIIAGHLNSAPVNRVVFSFHVPLFFLVSGYLFRWRPLREAGVRYARRLLVPYAFAALAIAVTEALHALVRGGGASPLRTFVSWLARAAYGSGTFSSPLVGIGPIGATWFLLALFGALMLYDLMADRPWTSLAVAVLFVAGLVSAPVVWLPLSVQSACTGLLFVHVGHLARVRWGYAPEEARPWLTGACLAVWLAAIVLDGGVFYLVVNHVTNVLVDVAGAICGSVVVVAASRRLERAAQVSAALELFGRHSLVVLVFHNLELVCVPWDAVISALGLVDAPAIALAIELCVKVAWGFAAIALVRRVGVLRAVFGT